MTDLRDRIFLAIAKARPSQQPEAVLAEIAKTHVLIERSSAKATILDGIADYIDRDYWDELTNALLSQLEASEP